MTIKQHPRTLHIGTEAERQTLATGITEGDQYLETDTHRLRIWLEGAWSSLGTASVIDNVSNPPTSGELDAIFGNPEDMPNGARILVDDAGAGAKLYEVTPWGSDWWYVEWTKA